MKVDTVISFNGDNDLSWLDINYDIYVTIFIVVYHLNDNVTVFVGDKIMFTFGQRKWWQWEMSQGINCPIDFPMVKERKIIIKRTE